MKNSTQKPVLSACLLMVLAFSAGTMYAQTQISLTGGGSTAANGTYTYAGLSNSKPYFTNGIYRVEYRDGGFGLEWEVWNTTLSGEPAILYYFANTGNTPVITGWSVDAGTSPVAVITNLIAFTSGTGYTPPHAPPNTANNPVGRFFLDPGADGSNLTAATIKFTGTNVGITAVKLWSSTDATFSPGTDVRLNSKAYSSSVTFSGFSSAMSINGTYYFVTIDVNASSWGSVAANITNAAGLTASTASITTVFANAGLSSALVGLPVKLQSFTALASEHSVILNWSTASEENGDGFNLERSADARTWTTIDFVAGSGNSNTIKDYSYKDNNPVQGISFYRLKELDIDGHFIYSKQLLVMMQQSKTVLLQNSPNPFSQSTSVAFRLPEKSFTTLKVYNMQGMEITTLVSKQLDSGNYSIAFDGSGLPAGTYIYTLRYGQQVVTKTMLVRK